MEPKSKFLNCPIISFITVFLLKSSSEASNVSNPTWQLALVSLGFSLSLALWPGLVSRCSLAYSSGAGSQYHHCHLALALVGRPLAYVSLQFWESGVPG